MSITLEKLHEDLVGLKKEMEHIRAIVEEDYELSDDVSQEIDESRVRPESEFISHAEMKKEFG